MLAIAYLLLMVALGDAIARSFLGNLAGPRRLATAFLVGLVVSTWMTYLVAFLFSGVEQPLIAADAIVAWLMGLVAGLRLIPVWYRWRTTGETPFNPRKWAYGAGASDRWDWVLLVAIGAFVTWMMVSTFNVSDGHLNIAVPLWSDFGPTTAIAQSFAVGHNYPTQYPHFAGPSILYHFLFYFQVGNLTFLGLDPATANNVLSIAALTSMLALVMALGQRLFHSRATGRIAAILFFFHGALSFVPYLATFPSIGDAVAAITKLDDYLASGFPYRGEEWGIWTQNVFLNQRHLSTAIGILLIALLFVVERLQARKGAAGEAAADPVPTTSLAAEPVPTTTAAAEPDPTTVVAEPPIEPVLAGAPAAGLFAWPRDRALHPIEHVRAGLRDPMLPGYLATGLLLGLLPLWNSPMFIAAAALFGVIFVLFPNRVQMAVLAIAAAIPAIPQILFLRPPNLPGTAHYPVVHWGYIVDPPTIVNVATYLAFIFGLKAVLVGVALVGGTSLQRRIFVAASSLVAVAFLIQFSVEVFANHKFLNAWLVIANVFAAFGLVRLWGPAPGVTATARSLAARLAARWVAVVLAGAIVVGGAIDIVPIARVQLLSFPLAGDRLYDWVAKETKPTDVFLTDVFVTSPILLAGRAIYFGWPYYAWSAGYDADARQALYVRMLESRDAGEVLQLLQAEDIAYVAIDDGLRHSSLAPNVNEDLYRASFKVVFQDTEGKYQNMVIYQVPPGGSGNTGAPSGSGAPPAASGPPRAGPPDDMFVAGSGSATGRFAGPRGITVDRNGNVIVADTDNNLIERFSPDGKLVNAFGGLGEGPGQLHSPNGVGEDSRGHLFVADTLNHRLVEFDNQDAFVREWRGPDPGFYGPRDIAVGSDDAVYILDQGHARVVKTMPNGDTMAFGSLGAGPGQLSDPTGVAVGAGFVWVADSGNGRIQVWDAGGQFVRSVPVPEWSGSNIYGDVALSGDGKSLYASSPKTNVILVFSIDGARLSPLEAAPPDTLDQPAAIAVAPDGRLYVVDYGAARVSAVSPATH